MLNWQSDGSTLTAQTEFFKYNIVQDHLKPWQFRWILHVTDIFKHASEPESQDKCKQQAEDDYKARIEQGERVIEAKQFVK